MSKQVQLRLYPGQYFHDEGLNRWSSQVIAPLARQQGQVPRGLHQDGPCPISIYLRTVSCLIFKKTRIRICGWEFSFRNNNYHSPLGHRSLREARFLTSFSVKTSKQANKKKKQTKTKLLFSFKESTPVTKPSSPKGHSQNCIKGLYPHTENIIKITLHPLSETWEENEQEDNRERQLLSFIL